MSRIVLAFAFLRGFSGILERYCCSTTGELYEESVETGIIELVD
jgi:hypothetical protein